MARSEIIAALRAASRQAPRRVVVDGIGEVFVRELTVGDVDSMLAGPREGSEAVRNLARILCDEDGQPLFDVSSAEDLQILRGLPQSVMQRLLDKPQESTPGN